MEKVYQICNRCGDRHCCRGLCKEMYEHINKKNNKRNGRKEYGR